MAIDIDNFYLMPLMYNYEQLRINVKIIHSGIIKECDLDKIEHNGWVNAETREGSCSLPLLISIRLSLYAMTMLPLFIKLIPYAMPTLRLLIRLISY